MIKNKYKISIIGSGAMSQEYIKVIKSFDDFENPIIVSKSLKNKSFFYTNFNIDKFYINLEKMIFIEKPHLIIVVTSIQSTFDVLKIINKYKIPTLVEKPIGYNLHQAEKMKQKLNPKYFFIALNRRYYSNIKYLKKNINKSRDKIFINIFDQENNKTLDKKKFPIKIRNNWMYANSIHLIDLFYYLLRGKIIKIKLIFKDQLSRSVFIETDHGDKCIYTAIWNKPGPWSVQVSTNKAFYNLKNIESLQIKISNNDVIKKKLSKFDSLYKPGIHSMLKDTVNLLKNKKHNIPDLNYSYKLMKLINKIYDL